MSLCLAPELSASRRRSRFKRAAAAVALVDRLPEAAGETSFGNSGIVQTEGVLPYLFPRALGEVARAAANRDPRAHMRHGSLPSIAPAIWRYFRASTQPRKAATGKVMAPLLFAAAAST